MSLTQRKPLSFPDVSDQSETMEINQLYQSNNSNAIVADMLHRGLVSGDFKLADENFRCTILALTKNIIMVNEDIHNAKQSNCPYRPNLISNTFFGDKDFQSASSSLSMNSVHILDVTDDNSDKAQELSSHHQVSRIGDEVDDGVDVIEIPIPKKKRSDGNDAIANDIQSRKKICLMMPVVSAPNSIFSTIDEVLSYVCYKNSDAVNCNWCTVLKTLILL
jgi:hypothetical protein